MRSWHRNGYWVGTSVMICSLASRFSFQRLAVTGARLGDTELVPLLVRSALRLFAMICTYPWFAVSNVSRYAVCDVAVEPLVVLGDPALAGWIFGYFSHDAGPAGGSMSRPGLGQAMFFGVPALRAPHGVSEPVKVRLVNARPPESRHVVVG